MRPVDDTHDDTLTSWVAAANTSAADFPIQNLPLGVFRRVTGQEGPRIGVAIGDQILDLVRCAEVGLLEGLPREIREAATAPTLNALMALGAGMMSGLRHRLVKILGADGWGAETTALVPQEQSELLLPAAIGDFTDFYASIDHATNVGRLFRPENPLFPNYRHVPIAYHGRSSSIVTSGAAILRPSGQMKPLEAHDALAAGNAPFFGPSQRLDYEVEIGAFVGVGNKLGHPVRLEDAEDHLFGLCLLNDWSARDIQAWESQPLGPFLAKNFATSISPWVVTLEALAPFRTAARARQADDPLPLPYLSSEANEASGGFDVRCEVFLSSAEMRRQGFEPLRLSRNSFRSMYWTLAQMLTHHTSNGCNLRPGDLLGSGTVSGPDANSLGCLLEITRQGRQPIHLPTGESRTFLLDGDEVILRGFCEREGYARIGFGECRGIIVRPAT
jgi:fumarylacetoacetase